MRRVTSKELLLLSHNFQVRFALFCSYQIEKQWKNAPKSVEAIRVTELWLEGKASSAECCEAGRAASGAQSSNGGNANYAVACTAYTTVVTRTNDSSTNSAANASHAADFVVDVAGVSAKIIGEQWNFYNELLNFDKIAEKALLGEEA